MTKASCYLILTIICQLNLIGLNSIIGNVISSKGSGNWNSTTNNAPWPDGLVPVAVDSVFISNNHKINVTADASCAQLKVKPQTSGVADTSSVTINSGITLTVNRNVKIDQNSSGRIALIMLEGVLVVKGDFTNDGNFSSNSGKVVFNSTSNQDINGVQSTTFHDVELNTSGNVVLNKPVNITGTLTLTSGDLISSATNLLTVEDNDDPGFSGGSVSSHIVGPVEKKYSSTAYLTFPVGSGTRYMPVVLKPVSGTLEYWRIEYLDSSHTSSTICSSGELLDHLSSREYWNINRNLDDVAAQIRLYWDDSSFVNETEVNDLRITHFDASSSCWESLTHKLTTDTTNNYLETNININTFSPFSFGSVTSNNALPVTLLNFKVTQQGSFVKLQWETATEINNDYFTIDRSADGFHYEKLAAISGSGNSNKPTKYDLYDENPIPGISYYRLTQTDYDGQYEVLEEVAINTGSSDQGKLNISPNPVTDAVKVSFSNIENTTSALQIYNAAGKMVHNIAYDSKVNEIQLRLHDLTPGLYFIRIIDKRQGMYFRKFIKN